MVWGLAIGRAVEVEWVEEEEACRAMGTMAVLICGSLSIPIAIGESISGRGVRIIDRSEVNETELRHMATCVAGL